MNIERIKEYCNEEKPCLTCQIIYDACEHKTIMQINKYMEQCLFCYDYFLIAFDKNDNAV